MPAVQPPTFWGSAEAVPIAAIKAAVAIDAVVRSEISNLRMHERDNKAMLTSPHNETISC
jgi:hypothetical protein